MYSLGKRIKLLRKETGLKQEDFVCDILSRTMLSKIENDKVTPSIYQLNHIAKKLGVSIDFFLQTDSLSYHNNREYKDSLSKLFENENYLAIISKFEKSSFNIDENINYIYYAGYSYYKMNFYKESIKLLNKYIKTVLSLKKDDIHQYIENLSNSFNVISVIYFELEDYSKAIQNSLKAKDILQKNNYFKTRQYFMTINNLGYLYNTISDYEKCINLLEKFLSNNTEFIYIQIFASIHISLSSAYYNIGDYQNSIDHIKKAIFFFIYIKNEPKAIECYLNYINALRYSKQYSQAIETLDYVVLKYRDKFDSNLTTSFIMQKAILKFNTKNFDD